MRTKAFNAVTRWIKSYTCCGFSIAISEHDTHPTGVKLTWKHRPEWQDWARLSEGVYILRTNIAQWSDEELWKTYIQLTEAEAAKLFRLIAKLM